MESPWTPFDDASSTREFYDPYEGRQPPLETSAFFEDPFANTLPKNGWCRVPQWQRRRRRPSPSCWRPDVLVNPVPEKRQEDLLKSIPYESYRSFDLEEESQTHSTLELESDATSSELDNFALPTIHEETAVFAKLPPQPKKINVQDLEPQDYERVAQEQALKRVKQWLHQTGLVDSLFVDMKTLPQNRNRCSSQDSVMTTPSQEGVEVGPHGVTLEGDGRQIDGLLKEFRAVTLRQMDKIDEELWKLEQETVRPEKLNELNHTVVKSCTNARLNMNRVFAEVDYFHKIPANCELLLAELRQAGRDFAQVRTICDDHVAMQSFLVELTLGWMERQEQGKNMLLLEERIVAVRELGHKLRSKLLSRIGVAFGEGRDEELKCLVDAMQLYENEVEELKCEAPQLMEKAKSIMVTGIKRIAIERILEDAEIRAHEVFQVFQSEAADDAASTTADDFSFEAAMKACKTMSDAVKIVKAELIALFPPTWEVFPIWAACIGSVCSQYIVQEIGGREGNDLSLLTPNQLLKLMSWIEEFRDATGISRLVDLSNRNAKFLSARDLMRAERIATPQESMIQVLTVMWDVHRLIEDEFICATQVKTKEWLDNVFKAEHSKHQSVEGRLSTSLPEDLWILARVQLTAIRERFNTDSSVFVHAAIIIFRCMQSKQRSVWWKYLEDVETCCAAANDALRMIRLAEVELEDIKYDSDLTTEQFDQLDLVSEQLTTQYLNDAVFSAIRIHKYIFDPIEEALDGRLFSSEWEDFTHNDMAVTVVRTLEDYLGDLEKWMEEAVLRKALDALVRASVNFYIKQLLKKSIRRQKHTFVDTGRALLRISGDIHVLEDFFEEWISKFPALERVLEKEFEVLYAMLELLEIGFGTSQAKDPSDFFPFLYKKIGQPDAAKFFCCQLWHMLGVEKGRTMRDMFDATRDRLTALDDAAKAEISCLDPSLELKTVIVKIMEELRERLKVKTVAKNVKTKIVDKAGKFRKRASLVIDRIAEA